MSKLVVIWDRHIERISYLPAWVRHPAWYKNQARCLFMEGEVGFKILGAEAQQAVPELMSLYEQTFSNDSVAAMDCQISIIRALVDIGPPAISSLLRWANSSSEFENALAVYALSQIHAQPSVVVPVLVRCLGHTNSYVRMRAAEGLGNFGREASQAVPPLVQALSDPVKPVRSEVTQALKKIDPEALAQASVK